MVAWMFASNHCAIGAMMAAADDHACCHQSETSSGPVMECCHALSAPLPAAVVIPVSGQFVLLAAWEEVFFLSCAVLENPAAVLVSAQGPPGAFAFAELVLNRSLLAHAPPVVVA